MRVIKKTYFVKTVQYIPDLQRWDKLNKPYVIGFFISVPLFSGPSDIMTAITAQVYKHNGDPVGFRILDIKAI